MIMTWWAGCSPREKWLVAIAGALSVMLVLGFGVLKPIVEAKQDARQRLDLVSKDHVLVERALRTLNRTGPATQNAGPAQDNDGLRSQVTRMAQQSGLAIARVQASEDGTVQFVLSDVSPPLMYAWLDQVSRLPGGETYTATVTKRDDTIQAVIEIRGQRS